MAIHPTVALALLCLFATAASARPGDLDATFSGDGLATSTAGSAALAVIQQTDDKLVFVADGGAGNFVVARLAPDGTPDASYGSGGQGVATIDMGGVDALATALVRQSDGLLVAAGSSDGDIALVRLDANGAPDPAFSGDGKLVLDLGDADDAVAGMLQQPDDKLVVVATSGGQIVFVRFNADGSPDDGFGTAGISRVDFGGAPQRATGLARQSDGKLVATGVDTGAGQSRFNIVRVTDTGALDATFDGDGLASVAFAGSEAAANGVAVQADGKILVTGYFVSTANAATLAPTGRIVRLTDTGALDATFSGDGIATVDAGSRTIPNAVIVQPDTSIVVTGVRGPAITADGAILPPADLFITRITAAGATDLVNFGVAGIATADFGSADQAPASAGRALVRQSDGRIVVVGESAGTAAIARFADADNAGLIGLTWTASSAPEGSVIFITVRRTGGTTGVASVDYATIAGSAHAGTDYTAASGTLVFDNSNFQTVTITTSDDSAFEGPEDFTFALSNPVGVQLAASQATVTLGDNDTAMPGTIAVAAGSQSVGEGAGAVSIRVTRTGGSDGAVSVQYATASGTATAGSDFTPANGTLNWAAGDTADKVVDVDIPDDTTDESNETFTLTLSAPAGGATLGAAVTTVTITDDDTAGGGGGGGGGALGLEGIALLALALLRRAARRCRS